MNKLVEQAKELPEIGATRALVHDPSGGLEPHQAAELVTRVKEASGLPVGFYCQGAGGTGLADSLEAARAGADLIAATVYPLALSLHRVAGESLSSALAGMGMDTGVDVSKLWEASDLVDEHIGDEIYDAARAAPRRTRGRVRPPDRARRRARHTPARPRRRRPAARDARRAAADPARDRLAAARGADRADPRLAGADPRPLRAPLRHGRGRVPLPRPGRLRQPARIDRPDRRTRRLARHRRRRAAHQDPPTAEDVRAEAEGLAASEEELVLIALFGEEAEALIRTIRARHTRDDRGETVLEESREQRIRELVRIVQESGVAEVEIEDEGMRVSVRRAEERPPLQVAAPLEAQDEADLPVVSAPDSGAISASSRRWSASSTALRNRARPRSSTWGTSSHPARRSACSRR